MNHQHNQQHNSHHSHSDHQHSSNNHHHSNSIKKHGNNEIMKQIASDILNESYLICFDEFQVRKCSCSCSCSNKTSDKMSQTLSSMLIKCLKPSHMSKFFYSYSYLWLLGNRCSWCYDIEEPFHLSVWWR
jgi:ABC-type Zn2+ transport system substrate-binding protein/surface adhesin